LLFALPYGPPRQGRGGFRPASAALVALLGVACSSGPSNKEVAAADTASATPADRGPTTVTVDGDPNGLWWSDGVLYIADDDNNRILSWTDADGGTNYVQIVPVD
jgi:hypothetical protein